VSAANPHDVCDLAPYSQERPYALVANEGKVFVGSTPSPGSLEGALTVYDPANGQCDVHVNIVPNQSIIGLTYADGKIYGGTSVWGNLGDTPVESDAKLLIYDVATDIWTTQSLPVAGIKSMSGMVTGPDGQVWCVAENYLFSLNPLSGNWTSSRLAFPDLEFPPDHWATPNQTRMIVSGGMIYGAMFQDYLFSFDIDSGQIDVLHRGDVREIAADGYGNIYTILNRTNLMRYSPAATSSG
jgi:hypothetical protein